MSYLVISSLGQCKSETYVNALESAVEFIHEIRDNYSNDPADWFAYIVNPSTSLREVISYDSFNIRQSGFLRL